MSSADVPTPASIPPPGLRLAVGDVVTARSTTVRDPYSGEIQATVSKAGVEDVEAALASAAAYACTLTRHERHSILVRARERLQRDAALWARRITLESGLCLKDTHYEVGRACDVLLFAAQQTLVDDGQVFSCDITAHGQQRKVYTTREPLLGAITAITPFNHPLNQVVHKVAPSVATGNRMLLKPSEKTPLTALAFADLLYESGLPREMLQVLPGDPAEIGDLLLQDPRVDLITFTGSSRVGRRIAAEAGYKRIVLELGGNDPLIVMEDADFDAAVQAACRGAFRNSGQRCTSVKRLLVHASIADRFAEALAAQARALRHGDPLDPETDVGTVIDADAADRLGRVVADAVAAGARLLHGGRVRGACIEPTVLDQVRPEMEIVAKESFGPLAPIIRFDSVEEAIAIANASQYALSAGVFTQRIDLATRCIRRLQAGTVNINEVPGYRLESTPFGGLKDSGLGYKEGVVEAMKAFTNVKSYSLPW
jgi:phosphonoacetaldehyde dehydrogenase